MSRLIAVSDIHGCFFSFKSLIEEKVVLTKKDQLYLLGDYIDRGPSSKEVIDYIILLKKNGYNVSAVKGNHEEMLLRCIGDDTSCDLWSVNGGTETLTSYGVDTLRNISQSHLLFYKSLLNYIPLENHLLVHAGFNFNAKDIFYDDHAMMWLRDNKVDPSKTNGKIVVHGHTPTRLSKIKEMISNSKRDFQICIDNGCVYGRGGDTGNLIALELNTEELWVQENID